MKLWILSSSLLILIVLVLRRSLRGKVSPRLQYALWLLVLLRLLIPGTLISSPISIAQLLPDPNEPTYTVATQAHQFQRNTGYYVYMVDEYEPAEPSNDLLEIRFDWRPVLTGIWIAGMVAVGLILLWSNVTFSLRLHRCRKQVPLHSSIPVYESASLSSPCLFGVFRPAIYLPEDIAAQNVLTPHILAHEAAHYRHGDHLWSLLRSLALALHWYNPLVWIAAILSKQDGELACDDSAIRHLGEAHRIAYGQTLLQLVTAKPKPSDILCCATTMTSGKQALSQRIRMIAAKPRMTAATVSLILVIVLLAAGCTLTGAQAHTQAPPSANAASITVFHHNLDVLMQRGDETVEKLLTLYNNQQIKETSQPMDTLNRITVHFHAEDGTVISWNITSDGICSNSQRTGNYIWKNNEYSVIADLLWEGLYYEQAFMESLNLSIPAVLLPQEEIAPLIQLFRSMELTPTSNEPDYGTTIRVMLEFDLAGQQPVPLFTIDEKGEIILHVSSQNDAYYMCKDGEHIYTQLQKLYESYLETHTQQAP